MSPPGWTTLILLLGKGYSTVTNKCNEDDVDALKPKGRTPIENDATKRIMEWDTLRQMNMKSIIVDRIP